MAERARANEGERLAQELHHRAGNVFTIVNAIVRMSARVAQTPSEVADKASDRITALANAHRVSIDSKEKNGREADVHVLASTILTPYRTDDGERFILDGPAVELTADLVTPLGLVLHELATNAVKYGALRRPDGRVNLGWTRADGELRITWREALGEEGAAVPLKALTRAKPEPTGLGSTLMDGMLRGVGGAVRTDHRPDGTVAEIVVPLP